MYLHADNCTAQNKNNATVQYLLWRVMTEKNDSIELSFTLVGHTKYSPDRFFGLIKKVYRHSSVSSLSELVGVVERSTIQQQNIAQLIDPTTGDKVKFRRWSAHLSRFSAQYPTFYLITTFASNPTALEQFLFESTLIVNKYLLMYPNLRLISRFFLLPCQASLKFLD